MSKPKSEPRTKAKPRPKPKPNPKPKPRLKSKPKSKPKPNPKPKPRLKSKSKPKPNPKPKPRLKSEPKSEPKPKHDSGYKGLFSEPRMVEDLLRGFVPGEWVGRLAFSTLEKASTSFVSEQLIERQDDLIWRLRFADQRRWLYVYLLLEFQSTPDRWMPLRVMIYAGLLWQDLIKQKQIGAGEMLPPVVPVVLYNGERKWNVPLDVEELVTPVEGLKAYRPSCRYLLLDEQRIALEEQESASNVVAALFRLEQSRTREEIKRVIEKLLVWISGPEQASLRRAFASWITQSLSRARLGGADVPKAKELSEVRDMLEQRVIEWTKEWKKEGLEEGLKKGMEKGMEKGLRAMLRLVEQRFGPLTAEQVSRLDTTDLDRIADKLLTAESFEELIGQ